MDIYEIRLKNLLLLKNLEKSGAALARKVGTDPAYINQIISPNIKARIGSTLARQIENAYNKPKGWMDQLSQVYEDSADYSPKMNDRVLDIQQCIQLVTDRLNTKELLQIVLKKIEADEKK